MEHLFYNTFTAVIKIANNGGIYLPECETIYKSCGWVIKILVHINLFLAITDIVALAVGEFTFIFKGEEAFGATKYYLMLGLGTLAPSYLRVLYARLRNKDIHKVVQIWENDLLEPPYPEDRKDLHEVWLKMNCKLMDEDPRRLRGNTIPCPSTFPISWSCPVENADPRLYDASFSTLEPEPEREVEHVQKFMSKMVKIQVFCFIIPLAAWSGRPVVTKLEVIPTGFPGDHYKTPVFEIITTFITFTGYYVGSVWSAFESLQILFMNSILAEIKHLHLAIDKIFSLTTENTSGYLKDPEDKAGVRSSEIEKVRKILGCWVAHHQALLRFSYGVNEFFGPMILLQNLTTIVFGFTALFVVTAGELRMDNRIEACSYLLFYYYVLYKSCSLGDEIKLGSMNIMENFEEKEWYFYPKDIIKSVLIIQTVTANRPIKLKAVGFKDLSCKSFGEITQKGYELITCLAHFIY